MKNDITKHVYNQPTCFLIIKTYYIFHIIMTCNLTIYRLYISGEGTFTKEKRMLNLKSEIISKWLSVHFVPNQLVPFKYYLPYKSTVHQGQISGQVVFSGKSENLSLPPPHYNLTIVQWLHQISTSFYWARLFQQSRTYLGARIPTLFYQGETEPARC